MSIMVAGGCDATLSPQESDASLQPLNANAPQPQPGIGSPYTRCIECDRGILSRKTAHRLSLPSVIVGYFLLIPSILGLLSCVCMLVAINAAILSSESAQPAQTAADTTFRRNCSQNVQRSVRAGGLEPSRVLTEEYCECALATFKATKSEPLAVKECGERAQDGTLGGLARNVDVLYVADDGDRMKNPAAPQFLLSPLSSTLLIGMGAAFFVAGLLGGLLVIRKRVLQCSSCGAVVNPS